MEWLDSLFKEQSAFQAVIVISAIAAVGLVFSKVKWRGIGFGVAFVFFAGILAGHLGLSVDQRMLDYAESFGLVLFVYALGLQVGPGFVSSFREGGARFNLLALCVIALGTILTIVVIPLFGISADNAVGVMCGATTNTPALGAAQQTLRSLGLPDNAPALATAVTYPIGVAGVILVLSLVRPRLSKYGMGAGQQSQDDAPFIASFSVCNPGIEGKTLAEIATLAHCKYVVSRLWRGDGAMLPDGSTKLSSGDRILVIAKKKDIPELTIFFGKLDNTDWNKSDIDWDALDRKFVSQRIVITRPEINGRKIGALHLRNRYDINVSRVYRSGIALVATPDLMLRMGDRLTVVGDAKSVERVAAELGNTVRDLEEPNLVAIFIGIVLGLALGSIPFSVPGVSMPVKLGLAGGPIVVGILIGAYGPRLHMVTYTTNSANLMLRALGLSIYLASLGLESGAGFAETVMSPQGAAWVGIGALITILPVAVMSVVCVRFSKTDYYSTAGILCGAMANPMALGVVAGSPGNDKAAVAYATVYPLSMFLRVVLAQVLIMVLMG